MFKHRNQIFKGLLILSAATTFLMAMLLVLPSPTASAQRSFRCADGTTVEIPAESPGGVTAEEACVNNGGPQQVGRTYECADGTTVEIPAESPGGVTIEEACINNGGPPRDYNADCSDGISPDKCGITARLVDFINILSAIVGIVSTIMIVVWGIQYIVARDNPQMISNAKLKILQTVLALVAYLFVYAFLQWLVPGGVL